MMLRPLAIAFLCLAAGGGTSAVAGEANRCPDKRFAPNARVQAGEIDNLFGKLAPAQAPVRLAVLAFAPSPGELAGLTAEAGRFNATVEMVADGRPLPLAGQIDRMREAMAAAPDALLVLDPVPDKALRDLFVEAVKGGMPVVAVGMRAEGARVSVGVDEERLGAMAAEYLHELFPLGGSVVQLQGPADALDRVQRAKGFSDELKFYPNLALVQSAVADGDRAKAKEATLSLLAANPGVNGLYAVDDAMALGAVDALKSLKMNDVAVVGTEGTPDARAALTSRALKGTAARFPAKEGALAVQAALRLLQCQPVPPWIVAPQALMSPKSLEDFPSATQ